ncbi:MAG: UDP-N-acetylmuramoyl-L-alanine--D-glutamate ligase [Oligoflexia bacterium]|nr:UDP-N-acetylmuramoyl-L-alanine--D-glutamate ligase [Oligoflexia bacterium]
MSKFKDKKILIVGVQSTGVSLAKFFHSQGAKITISDSKTKEQLGAVVDQLEEFEPVWDLGGHTPKAFSGQDLIVLSPGVNPHNKIIEAARVAGTPVTGELELASTMIKEPIIAISGTNGKSTVTKLVHEFLKQSGVNAWIGGNFGTPLIDYINQKENADVLVVEVSSFQLETVDTFKPHHAILLNLAEDHIDRHRSMQEYVNAKKKMFKNASPESTSVLNADEPLVIDCARDPVLQRSKLQYFTRKVGLEEQIKKIGGAVFQGQEIRYYHLVGPATGNDLGELERYNISKMRMRGRHNVENIMAAIIAARAYGAKPDVIQNVINQFPGLPHRLEFVRKKGGVDFYNDSKSTNVHSVIKALEAFDEPIILIAGGKDKGVDFTPLIEPVQKKVKNLILTGEAKERLNRTIGDFSETFIIGTFEEAVLVAYQKSRNGDVILLSPGCSSFDRFGNFEERGNYYKDLISKL